ncbi:MAG TPA: hypothetical protein PKM40_07910, partial [Bacteroidia bacterium]|nr:hypothetical protein [Bacteroidia bacterium]
MSEIIHDMVISFSSSCLTKTKSQILLKLANENAMQGTKNGSLPFARFLISAHSNSAEEIVS